jgi:hypothetical protein
MMNLSYDYRKKLDPTSLEQTLTECNATSQFDPEQTHDA